MHIVVFVFFPSFLLQLCILRKHIIIKSIDNPKISLISPFFSFTVFTESTLLDDNYKTLISPPSPSPSPISIISLSLSRKQKQSLPFPHTTTKLIAISTAITIAVITTRTTTTTVKYTSFDALDTPTIRPSRFLAQKEVGERKSNAADHCNKDPEICSLHGGGGSNSTATCCNNKCIDVASDDNNCGACNNKCQFSQTCCRGQCVYLAYDKRHCGQCNHPCELSEFCVYGLCNYA